MPGVYITLHLRIVVLNNEKLLAHHYHPFKFMVTEYNLNSIKMILKHNYCLENESSV
jgi:hypothetical protein